MCTCMYIWLNIYIYMNLNDAFKTYWRVFQGQQLTQRSLEHPFLLLSVYLSTQESLPWRTGRRMQSDDPRPSGWPDIWAGWWKRRWWVFVRVFWQLKKLQGWFKGHCWDTVMGLWGVEVKVCMCSSCLCISKGSVGIGYIVVLFQSKL